MAWHRQPELAVPRVDSLHGRHCICRQCRPGAFTRRRYTHGQVVQIVRLVPYGGRVLHLYSEVV